MNNDERHQCFDRWLSEHSAMLHHVANGFADGADRHDLMQELLLSLWKAIPAYRQGSKPSTFIFRVAHNAALMWNRKERNYRRRVDRYETMAVHEASHDDGKSERERKVLAALYGEVRKLPPLDRSITLLMLDGLSYAEIAEIHGLTESNVGVRIHRLKQKLTHSMKGKTHEL